MKIRHTTSSGSERIVLQMTPMIDVVFQLLVFFIFTFRIVAQEGDFHVKMPAAAPRTPPEAPSPMPPHWLSTWPYPSLQARRCGPDAMSQPRC